MSNPFSGPFADAGPLGGNPFDDEANSGPRCPRCKSKNFDAYTHQYGLTRKCRDCKEEWSGGTLAAARSNWAYPAPHPDVPVPDDDLQTVQYTGGAYRDPSKNFGDDDW